jgi:hypothetical protein
MAEPKDLIVPGREKIVRDKLVTFGKYKDQNKLFSDITASDFDYCLEIVKDFKNMRDFYAYIMESDEMIAYEEHQEHELNENIKENVKNEKANRKKKN